MLEKEQILIHLNESVRIFQSKQFDKQYDGIIEGSLNIYAELNAKCEVTMAFEGRLDKNKI